MTFQTLLTTFFGHGLQVRESMLGELRHMATFGHLEDHKVAIWPTYGSHTRRDKIQAKMVGLPRLELGTYRL